jgi:hypothetical protein
MVEFDAGGAASGAASGAAAGAVLGPWGAAAGGVAGGIYGGFKSFFGGGGGESAEQKRQRQMMAAFNTEVQGREVPLLGDAAQAGMSDFRGDQRDLVGRLQAMASGQGPSLAQEQLRAGVDRATNQQYAMAAGARGNAGLAQRNAMNTAGMMQSQAGQQAAMLRAQEQLGALSQIGQAAGQGRAMDDSMAQYNTWAQNQFSMANQAARLQAEQQRDQSRLAAMGVGTAQANHQAQQPDIIDKLGAAAQGYAQYSQGRTSQQPAVAQRNGPYGNNTINPFQEY